MKHGTKGGLRLRTIAENSKAMSPANDAAEIHSSTQLSGVPTGRSHPQKQSGALAWRRSETGGIEILLVRKMRSGGWGIPKGKLTAGLSSSQNAAKEAFEEAGIKGDIDERIAATYRAIKRKPGERILIEVSVHMLEVKTTLDTWPEKDRRDIRWCTISEASLLLHEPALVALCRGLANEFG